MNELEKIREELANEIAYNEGWQEHISDLLDAMKPFVVLVKTTNGNIPTNRLSFANWHALTKAFDAAVLALNIPKAPAANKPDWRIGLSVKPKYRTDPRYYERGEVIDVRPGGVFDDTGVLAIKLMSSGEVILQRADDWVTA